MKKSLFLAALATLFCCPFTGCTAEESASSGLAFRESIGGTYTVSGVGTCTDEEIVIPSKHNGKPVVAVGTYAFLNSATVKKITLSEGIKRVEDSAFKNCDALVSVRFSSSLEEIASGAFADCNALQEVTFPKNAKTEKIGTNAFESCTSLEGVSFPVSVEKIDNYAFMNCSALREAHIPEGTALTSIGWSAFWGCQSLTEIRIPGAITYMEWAVFKGCTALERAFVGTKEEFARMTYNSENEPFQAAKKYYYSPSEPLDDGNYWHFQNGKIVVWE